MNEEQLQQQFMLLLVQEALKAGAKTEEDVKAFISLLGEEKIKLMYMAFREQATKGKPQVAALGAKLEYFKSLKGSCPEGEELVYFKKGGRICKACQGKKMLDGAKLNPVKEFKNKKKSKKLASGGDVPYWKLMKESYNGWGEGERWKVQAHNMFTQMDANLRAAFDTDGEEGLSRDEVINMLKSLGFTGRMLDGKIGRDTIARFEKKFGKLDYNNNKKDLIVGNYSPYLEENRNLHEVVKTAKRKPKVSTPDTQPLPDEVIPFIPWFIKSRQLPWKKKEEEPVSTIEDSPNIKLPKGPSGPGYFGGGSFGGGGAGGRF